MTSWGENVSSVRFVYYKVTFHRDVPTKVEDLLSSLRNTYAEYLGLLEDGVHGYGRFFFPSGVVQRNVTGHFAFIVNEFKDQQSILDSLTKITNSLSMSEGFAYEISERQFIDEIAKCGKGTACSGWKYVKKEVFGPKDHDNWVFFARQMNFLRDCVSRTSQW